MSLTNIKSNLRAERGFTIVELLIVVVVIAILAAITIVSYNGITSRANASASKTALGTAQKKIELYNSEVGNWPISKAALSGSAANDKSYFLPSTSYIDVAPDSDTGKKQVQIQACRSNTSALTTSNVTGIRITWYEFDKSSGAGTTTQDLGNCGSTPNLVVLNA